MSVKALKVLAPCMDKRSTKRFAVGEIFDPAPTEEQARRLVKAGCLPEEAIAVAKKADAEAEKKADAAAKAKAEEDAKNAAIATATGDVEQAKTDLAGAEEAEKAATGNEDKAKAAKAATEAKAALKKAEDTLEKLTK